MNGVIRPALVLLLVLALVVAGALVYLHAPHGRGGGAGKPAGSITVCNAGSLTLPLQEIARGFEKEYGVRVLLEPSGSVLAVRKVTELGNNCDVVAVSDYRLIPGLMMPRYADWYVAFASNRIVIAFTGDSRYAEEAKRLNGSLRVLDLLVRQGVRYGFSDPNQDPGGYRAVGAIGLAALEEHNLSILERLVTGKIRGAYYRFVDGVLHIYIPPSPETRENLVMRPKEVDLVSLLEAGNIDYAFEYLSVAVQHNLSYVALPPSISLGDPSLAANYSRVVVHIMAGTPREKAIPMAPIVYGVTVPKNAEHPREAVLFVKYLLEKGREVFNRMGQPFLEKPIGYGELPGEIRGLVRAAGK